jgi:hypothetical protein
MGSTWVATDWVSRCSMNSKEEAASRWSDVWFGDKAGDKVGLGVGADFKMCGLDKVEIK